MSAMPHRLLRCLGTSLTILATSSCALAQSGDDEPSPTINPDDDTNSDSDENTYASDSDFRYYFSVTTETWEKKQGRDWANQLQFDTDVLSKDFVILYQHLTGLYPMGGPHISASPAYMRAHLNKLVLDVEKQIPDPNFSGIAILDYERFPAIWDRVWNHPSDEGPGARDEDYRDDWLDHTRLNYPDFDSMSQTEQDQLLRETWEAAVRNLFESSINKAREVRPHARWGFYGYPYRFYTHPREAPIDVISYGDGTHHGSDLNDRLQWMWNAVDIVTPSVYALRAIVEPTEECDATCTPAEDFMYIKNMIGEAKRVADGKPVMPFLTTVYAAQRECYYYEEISDANLWGQVMGPALAGADGAMLWGHIRNLEERDSYQILLDTKLIPLMRQGIAERNGGGTNEASGDGSDETDSDAEDDRSTAVPSRGGVVSRTVDRPKAPTRATKISTRRSTRVPAIPFNPRTDRISKPNLTPEELREAIRRAVEIREKAKSDEKDKDEDD